MSCNCNIFISYSYQEGEGSGSIFTYTDVELSSQGIINGRSYYTFTDDNFTFHIIWRFGAWNLISFYGTEFETVHSSLNQDLDCPGANIETVWEDITAPFFYVKTLVPCQLSLSEIIKIKEEINCFNLKVWKIQCTFAKCVLQFFQLSRINGFDHLKFKKLLEIKIKLELLNCYNINDFTEELDFLKYEEVNKLLNC